MTVGSGLLVSRPCQQEIVTDHLSKDTWHGERMTSVNLKSVFQVCENHESE
jgi:hypothetical protein